MKFVQKILDKWSTPPRSDEYEELWGVQGSVDSVRQLFLFFLISFLGALLGLIAGMPFFTAFCVALVYFVFLLRDRLFRLHRLSMDSFESKDYVGIIFYILPRMLAIWIVVGGLLSLVYYGFP
jgi:hypothetical protein